MGDIVVFIKTKYALHAGYVRQNAFYLAIQHFIRQENKLYFRMVKDELVFFAADSRINRHIDGADLQAGKIRKMPFRPVRGGDDGNLVAALNAFVQQSAT